MLMSESYHRIHCWLCWAFGPFSGRVHRLTSPQVQAFHGISLVRTRRKSAPFRVGYPHLCGPVHPITRWHSFFPSSPTLCSIPLPDGRDTTYVGSIGLTQLLMKKNMSGTVGVCTTVGIMNVTAPSALRRSYPPTFWYGLSASLAICLSRGFRMTLHLRSTLPTFPRPSPTRGCQRTEHCPQGFAPQITPQHVWVGTPGHHRARSGSLSPSSILLHEPYEVQRVNIRSPPGHSALMGGAFCFV